MSDLTSTQKKYLRGLAHRRKPVVLIGQKGITSTLIKAIDEALEAHELIKIRFLDIKEKEEKADTTDFIVKRTGSQAVGRIGHTVIFYRPRKEPEKRKIRLPDSTTEI